MTDLSCWDDSEHTAWLGLGARVGHFMRTVAERRDIVATIGPGSPHDVPGSFTPGTAAANFSASATLTQHVDDPNCIDPRSVQDRARFAALAGVICHEAAHATHTRFSIPSDTSPEVAQWITLLEEPRIEGRLVKRRPQDRGLLRSASKHVILDTCDIQEGDWRSAARMAVLLLARADAGVFGIKELGDVEALIEHTLGTEQLFSLRGLWCEALDLADEDVDGLRNVAERIVNLLGDNHDQDDKDQDSPSGGHDQDGQDDNDEGEGDAGEEATRLPCGAWTDGEPPDTGHEESGEREPGGSVIRSVLEKLSDDAQKTAQASAGGQPVPRPDLQRRLEGQHQQDAAATAQAVFGGTSAEAIRTTRTTPSAAERLEARKLTGSLRRAQFRARHVTTTPEIAPPGRLRMGELMRRDAQRASHARITAQPWRRVHRRTVDNPPLAVGLSLDVSGSMDMWQRPVAAIGWSLANAVSTIRGKVAATVWNGQAQALLRPGEAPRSIPVASCGGGSTGCPDSLSALDGALNLTHHSAHGARLIITVTDGMLPNRQEVVNSVRLFARAGVGVLWVTPEDGWAPRDSTHIVLEDPEMFAATIGPAITAALTAA